MRLCNFVLLVFFVTLSQAQEGFKETNLSFRAFQEAIAEKDTLISHISKNYKCSENLSGRIEFYHKGDKLKLIKHTYQQGFARDVYLEYFFIENDMIRLKTSISEIIRMNTLYKKSSQGSSSLSAEKVVEVIEHAMFFKENGESSCYERRHGEILSKWDVDYFETVPFEKSNCQEDIEDIRYKYRLLRKAEKKLESYSNRKPSCIFHLW
ncbi:hypothetical protein M0D21_13465 [Aquimarina sp. D1M17]|uniref:hypothetical protein n=1 Tax=Aquimarina acroporae TaxID=2937283 RepID=UPI0020BD4E6A|nr:hypothetical protein [Aquimarina acroporae]MCK8522587.1 hypothetical protein [Aquimarina acroporae]